MRRLLWVMIIILLLGSTRELSAQIDTERMQSLIRTTLEAYSSQHPNREGRVWAMIFLQKLHAVDSSQLPIMTELLKQMGSRDELIQKVAIAIIRDSIIEIDQKEWVNFLTPLLSDVLKTSPYPDVKSTTVKYLSALSKLDEDQLVSIPALLATANDPTKDEEHRKMALNLMNQLLIEHMDEDWWEGVLRREMLEIMRTSPYPETRIISAQILELLYRVEELDKKILTSLSHLIELAQDEEAQIRELALKIMERIERETEKETTAAPRW